jgi:hypothetical protein
MRPVECSLGVSFRLCHPDLLQRPFRLAQPAGGSLTLAVDGLELEFGDVAVQEHDALLGEECAIKQTQAVDLLASWLARMGVSQ